MSLFSHGFRVRWQAGTNLPQSPGGIIMRMLAVTRRSKTIFILSLLLLAVSATLDAQSGTKGRIRKRTHRIFAAQTGPDQVTLAWDEVPGTMEYNIYLPDPNNPGPPAPGSRPTMSLSGSGRRAIVTGVRRMADGAYLEALGQGEVLYRGTFNAIARAPLARPTPPATVQARETGETEVSLTWSTVPGATAYMLSRAVGGSGWQMLCDVCPPSGDFVDTDATPGLEHTYTVAAIFPLGISTRTSSNTLTVGAAQLAAATASAPPAVWDKPMSSGTPVPGTDADNTNVGASTGTPTNVTPTGTTTPGTGTTTPSTGSNADPCTPVVVPKTGIATIFTKPMSSGTPVAGTDADNTNVGASAGTPTTGSTGGCPTGTGSGGTGTGTGTGTSTGGTGAGTNTGGTGTGTSTGSTPGGMPAGSGTTVQPVGGSGPVHGATPVTATPTAASCKLDYQRADNMWAAFGRPDGLLGVESISLPNGQAKVFVTDWAYEKQRNDGANYYGSHLRVATNPGTGIVQLRLKNPVSAMFGKFGAVAVARLGAPGWLVMQPGDRAEFKDDLMEVHCGQ